MPGQNLELAEVAPNSVATAVTARRSSNTKLSMDYLSQGSDTRATWLLECSHWLVRLVDRVPGAMQEQLEKNFGEFERACLEQRRSQTQ